jgi:hypothetical protein
VQFEVPNIADADAPPLSTQGEPRQHRVRCPLLTASWLDGPLNASRRRQVHRCAAIMSDKPARRAPSGYATNWKLLPVVQSTSFSGISCFARSMKFVPLQCMGNTCSRSNLFNSAITWRR